MTSTSIFKASFLFFFFFFFLGQWVIPHKSKDICNCVIMRRMEMITRKVKSYIQIKWNSVPNDILSLNFITIDVYPSGRDTHFASLPMHPKREKREGSILVLEKCNSFIVLNAIHEAKLNLYYVNVTVINNPGSIQLSLKTYKHTDGCCCLLNSTSIEKVYP